MPDDLDSQAEDIWARLKPKEPLPSQCCGSGCRPCVFDTYQKEIERWTRAKERGDPTLLTGNSQSVRRDVVALSPESFIAFQLESVEALTEDTNLYRFKLPSAGSLGLQLGQHLVLRGVVDGLEVQRAYTPISPVTTQGSCEFLIKLYKDGLMSQYIRTWKAGQSIEWRGPFGGFSYKSNKHGQLLMIASGTGIAPMIPLLQAITDDEEDETFVMLVGCFRTYRDIYMKDFLQEQAHFWNVTTYFVLSKEESLENLPWSYREKTHLGRLDMDVVHTLVKSCQKPPFALICGSVEFNNDVFDLLRRAGLDEESCFRF
ncbi:NADH-cytochrome b5 reductase-like isoform X2 [Megalops cyprinoides]|uniref:NADH-cytochrome b5 reductase-like isoform X2 n=1 Tax=Megalops cyprinoides TaxID=118141 RepID=UPI001863EF93|nr:NADH-cytochrome b5 reductase-like isoform X2 [Megalops cyprinoides]